MALNLVFGQFEERGEEERGLSWASYFLRQTVRHEPSSVCINLTVRDAGDDKCVWVVL